MGDVPPKVTAQEELIETTAEEANTLRHDIFTARANSETLSVENARIASKLTKANKELVRMKSELAQVQAEVNVKDETHKVEMDEF